MDLGKYVRMPGDPSVWVCAIEDGYRIAIPWHRRQRVRLSALLQQGCGFGSAEAFATTLDEILRSLQETRAIDAVRHDCFKDVGSEIIQCAVRTIGSGKKPLVKVVDAVIHRECELVAVASPRSLMTQLTQEGYSFNPESVANAYLNHRISLDPDVGGKTIVRHHDDIRSGLRYLRRTFWDRLGAILGFCRIGDEFRDYLTAAKSPDDELSQYTLGPQEYASNLTALYGMDERRCSADFRYIASRYLDEIVRALVTGRFYRLAKSMLLNFHEEPSELPCNLLEVFDSVTRQEFSDEVLGATSTIEQPPVGCMALHVFGAIPRDVADCLGMKGDDVARGVAAAPKEEPSEPAARAFPVAADEDTTSSEILGEGSVRGDDHEIDSKRVGRRGPWCDDDMTRVRRFFDRIAALEVGALILASEIYVATGFDSGSILHHVNREKGPFWDCLLDRHSLNPVDNKTWRYTRESVLRWLVKAHKFVDDDRLKSLGAIPAKHANAIESKTKPKPKRKG